MSGAFSGYRDLSVGSDIHNFYATDGGWGANDGAVEPAPPEVPPVKGPNLADREWHLRNPDAGQGGRDLNLVPLRGEYTGAGVRIGIWDDGIQYDHPDLQRAYDPTLHIRIGSGLHDPYASGELAIHGTAVAGIIAAADDGAGVVGVAPDARIAGVDILSPDGTTANTFRALKDFDITNHSWGPDYPYQVEILGRRWVDSYYDGLYESAVLGRGGLGTINVFSAGNDRTEGRQTIDSLLTGKAHGIAVGAVTQTGDVSWYSTPGATLLVSAPSNGGGAGIWTTDRTGAAGYSDSRNEVANRTADYTSEFGGTSAAAPMVSGIVALMLEANPRLGWRDVQEILAHTARHVGSAVGDGPRGDELHVWSFNAAATWNGGGLHHSNDYGFGLVDAHAAVRLAESWTKLQTEKTRSAEVEASWTGLKQVTDGRGKAIGIELDVAHARDVETVALDLNFVNGLISDYRIALVSPSGTRSVLSVPSHDGAGRSDWSFSSKAFWGEDPVGTWKVRIADPVHNYFTGFLSRADLRLEGGVFDADDIHVITPEFSNYVGAGFGHEATLADRNGGRDTLNAATLRSDVKIDLADRSGSLDGVEVTLAGRFEAVVGGDGDDILRGARGHDTLEGMRGADQLTGRVGHDSLSGGKGADRLAGGSGNDRLFGGAHGDILRDGPGRDVLSGGAGADVFVLSRDVGRDRITDFEAGSDRIALRGGDFDTLGLHDRAGGGVRLSHGDDRLLLDGPGLTADALTESDFLFA